MKRERAIIILALVHGLLYVLAGLWTFLDATGAYVITGAEGEGPLTGIIAGLLITTGASMLWASERGVLERPMRVAAAGASATFAIAIFSSAGTSLHPFVLVHGLVEILLFAAWAGILITSDSPYRPRPVMKAKQLRQRL